MSSATSTGTCRAATCRATILWAKTEGGKNMPLDPRPDPDHGTILLWGERKVAKVFGSTREARAYQFMHGGDGPYTTHFATCPARKQFSKQLSLGEVA